MKMEQSTRITPETGTIYLNHNGNEYLCTKVNEDGSAIMERLKDGWTLTAHGVCQYEDGTIEWDYSSGGRWTR